MQAGRLTVKGGDLSTGRSPVTAAEGGLHAKPGAKAPATDANQI